MTLSPSHPGVTAQNYIGKSRYVPDGYPDGLADDYRLYGRALSERRSAIRIPSNGGKRRYGPSEAIGLKSCFYRTMVGCSYPGSMLGYKCKKKSKAVKTRGQPACVCGCSSSEKTIVPVEAHKR